MMENIIFFNLIPQVILHSDWYVEKTLWDGREVQKLKAADASYDGKKEAFQEADLRGLKQAEGLRKWCKYK